MSEKSKHAIHMRRDWYDGEPERLTVSVQSDAETGERYTVFTTSSTWLKPSQVSELMDYLRYCQVVMGE